MSVVEKERLLGSPFYSDAVIPVAGFQGNLESPSNVSVTQITSYPGKRPQILEFIANELHRRELVSVLLKMANNEDGLFLWEPYGKENHIDVEPLESLILEKQVNHYIPVSGFIKSQ